MILKLKENWIHWERGGGEKEDFTKLSVPELQSK